MADINIASPGDTDVVSNFPANARASRTAILSALNGAAVWGGTSGGAAQAQTVTVSLTGWALDNGAAVDFIAGFANSAANPTLQVNSTTAKTVKNLDGGNLVAGDIVASRLHTVRYDGTNFRLLNAAVSGTPTGIAQAVYDGLFIVGHVQFRYDNTNPNNNLPSGVTATWTQITSTDARMIAIHDSAGVSATTGDFSTSTGTTGINNASHGVNAEGSTLVAEHTHTHSIPALTINPRRLILRAWRRTA